MTDAVCDSGPLTHLWQVGEWRAFSTFQAMYIPNQVAREVVIHVPLSQMSVQAGLEPIIDDVSEQEIVVVRHKTPGALGLHVADLATLAVALRRLPELVLTDDLATRRAIELQGQTPMGSVGVILRAHKAGMLDLVTLDRVIDNLFTHSTLYLSPLFKRYVRRLIASLTH